MLRFRSWVNHNRRALKDVAAKRGQRGIPMNAPLALQRVVVAVHLDRQFARFAELVGGAVAETYFLRALQYAAEHDGATGMIHVTRERFGATVLTRPWQIVAKETGKKVYDALLASTICVRIGDDSSADTSADGREGTRPDGPRTGPRTDGLPSADGEPSVRGRTDDGPPVQGGALPPALPGEQGGDSRSRGYARDARAASFEPDGPRTGPRTGPRPPSPSPSSSPPSPSPGESEGPPAPNDPPPGEGDPPGEGPALRPRERERFGRVVEYVVRCGATAERVAAVELRRRHREGAVPDAEIAELLAGPYAWVTRERLARWQDEARAPRDDDAPPKPTAPPASPVAPRNGAHVEVCQRHGRAAPCSVCATLATPPADPGSAASALDEIRGKLGRRRPSRAESA